jgi:hypothetical protein
MNMSFSDMAVPQGESFLTLLFGNISTIHISQMKSRNKNKGLTHSNM